MKPERSNGVGDERAWPQDERYVPTRQFDHRIDGQA